MASLGAGGTFDQVEFCEEPNGILEIGILNIDAIPGSATCFGDSDGDIEFTVTGGNPPYTYTYVNSTDPTDMGSGTIGMDGGMDNILNLLGGASYQIVVTDSSIPTAETTTEMVMIPEPFEIAGQLAELNPICAGDLSLIHI